MEKLHLGFASQEIVFSRSVHVTFLPFACRIGTVWTTWRELVPVPFQVDQYTGQIVAKRIASDFVLEVIGKVRFSDVTITNFGYDGSEN